MLEQVKLYVAKSKVPACSTKVEHPANDPNVTVPELLIVNPAIVLLLNVIVPVPSTVNDKLVNVPVLDSTKLLTFNDVVARVNAVVPKSNVLNQLPVVITGTPVPEPVNVKLGLLVVVPPVVPNI